MKAASRILVACSGLLLVAAGGLALACAYFGAAPLGASAGAALEQIAAPLARFGVDGARLEAVLVLPALRFSLLPVGFGLFALSFRGAKRGSLEDEEHVAAEFSAGAEAPKLDRRTVKKTIKQAAALRKRGQPIEAAQVLLESEELEKAAEIFIEAGEFSRAAQIRHDQNRFRESAELYLEGGDYASAGAIFAQHEDYVRAAECYLEIDGKITAAEMFEKAGDFRQAGDCYREAEFLRHAAQAYVRCKAWRSAAQCLEAVLAEESARVGAGQDGAKQSEFHKLVRQTGKLYQRAGDAEKAMAVFEAGGCHGQAAEMARQLGKRDKAAELYQQAGESLKAAEALDEMGQHEEAARILGEHHRDQGDLQAAAEHFEKANELMAAADLYRQLEDHGRAARCYWRQGDYSQAAEMFRLAGERVKAADAYEKCGRFTEAAECCALSGLGDREAELLERSGDYLGAGEVFHREGIDESAIKVLQQVDGEGEESSRAAALLGDIFRSRGQLSLAIKKLRQAIGAAELSRDNLPSYYTLATIHQENGECREAVDIFERIMTLDYHHRDVQQRLVTVREQLESNPPQEASAPSGASGNGMVSNQPGRYQIVGELGRGGMGIVYKAKDTVLDRLVAYKVLPDALKENPQALRNFLREAKAAASLNHPNIVTVYDTGEQEGRYYIAMEYVDGTTIKEILRRRGTIAPAGILHVLVQMCEALSYAHGRKVVHRDVKTANTMWTRDKKAKLMDFGLAKVVEEVRNHTTVVSGTPYYMSPEQTLGKNVDYRTDIYSLGVTLFEMASGTVPFKEGNIPYHHVHTPPPDVRDFRSDLPASIVAIIERCLEKDPANRYQSTDEILEEVRSAIQEGGI